MSSVTMSSTLTLDEVGWQYCLHGHFNRFSRFCPVGSELFDPWEVAVSSSSTSSIVTLPYSHCCGGSGFFNLYLLTILSALSSLSTFPFILFPLTIMHFFLKSSTTLFLCIKGVPTMMLYLSMLTTSKYLGPVNPFESTLEWFRSLSLPSSLQYQVVVPLGSLVGQ